MMNSNKPYLINALYEWIVDNDCTPYLTVIVNHPEISVPMEYAVDGQITLSISPGATRQLEIGKQFIGFSARFSGIPHDVLIPVDAVVAIFAKENGQGMAFDPVIPEGPDEGPETPVKPTNSPRGKGVLRVVK